MGIIIDLILLAVLAVSAIIGKIRGLIRSVMRLVTFVASVLVGILFTPAVSSWLFEHFKGFFSGQIYSFLSNQMQNKNPADFFAALPENVTSIANRFGISASDLADKFNAEALEHSADHAIHTVSEYMADPVAALSSKVVAFLFLFLVTFVACTVIAHLLNLVAKLPVLHTANALGGLLIGAVFGLAWVWILCVALNLLSPVLAVSYPEVFSAEVIHESMIFKFIEQYLSLGMLN